MHWSSSALASRRPVGGTGPVTPPASSPWRTLRVESRGWLGILTLDRPSRMNTITPQLVHELRAALDDLIQAGSKAIIITGNEKAFCAGADLSVVQEFKSAEDFM